jgi:hypothetical protein
MYITRRLLLIHQNPAPAPLVAKVLLETLIYETPVLGITDFNRNSYLRVYPNPTNGKLNIMLDRNCNQIEISLSNSTGKKVLIEKIKGQ